MKKTHLILLIILTTWFATPSNSCTTAIISGKYTKDGRPLLWKHRDTDFLQNKLMYFSDGKYDYIGVVNSKDSEGTQVWAGTNSAGFAIMNAALYDVNLDNPTNYKDQEGYVMKKALQTCATIEDFEKMLKDMEKPLGVASTFGVIDAKGGAAYYETDNYDFVKYNVNDSKLAPNGYIIRSNYSYRGEKDKGYGYIRYQNAQKHLYEADATGDINFKTFIKELSRSTYHSLMEKDFKNVAMETNKNPYFINPGDLIVRNSSASAVVIHGVKKGESPQFTTMWTLLGYPYTTVACPVWVEGGINLPQVLVANNNENAPICDWALKLKEEAYPIKRGSGYKYLNITALYNKQKTGITQQLRPVENVIINHAEQKLMEWRKSDIKKTTIQDYYKWMNNYLIMKYEEIFNLTLTNQP